MKRRFLLILAVLLAALLLAPTLAIAYYGSVTGELRDSDTGQPWQYGGTVEIWNCNTLNTIITQVVPSGVYTFNIGISTVVTTPTALCVEVAFSPGPLGTPGNAAGGPFPDRASSAGILNTGVYFTGTGPTAITLANVTARSANRWLPVGLAAVALVGVGGGLLALRRRR
jgi:hypothetical protein